MPVTPKRSAFALLLTVTAVAWVSSPTANATLPGSNGRIAYVEGITPPSDTPEYDIFVVNGDARYGYNLTKTPKEQEREPAWSPDGTRIAFIGDTTDERSAGNEVFIVNMDGSGRTQVTNSPGRYESAVEWSPDGTRLAFAATNSLQSSRDIFLINTDGSSEQQLTTGAPAAGEGLSWSPDGSSIVFTRSGDGLSSINVSTKAITQLTATGFFPDHSPDGSKLAYVATGSVADTHSIFVANANGSQPTQITPNAADQSDGMPRWAPDGSKILFSRSITPDNTANMSFTTMTVNPDGSGLTTLTENSMAGDWQPCSSNCATTTAQPVTLFANNYGRGNKPQIAGQVDPQHHGAVVRVKLYVMKAGQWDLADTKSDTIDEEEFKEFKVNFTVASGKECKAVAKFIADGDHLAAKKTIKFNCG